MQNLMINSLLDQIEQVIVGKRNVLELVVTSLLAGGHVLIEDVPGVGKTQMVAAMANACEGIFHRIQMTPDVMPGDITGFTMINQVTREMEFRKGAAFCNFLLADEINRASPKSQSALLEIMEEGQVSLEGHTYGIPEPFMVLATQNPVETYGTYHLPEAQMDRFLMKLSMGYPGRQNEREILHRNQAGNQAVAGAAVTIAEICELKKNVQEVTCANAVEEYILDIVEATRRNEGIRLGISPRGTLALYNAAKAFAFLKGRDYVLPDDVKYLVPYVLSHRLILSPQGKAKWGRESECWKEILSQIEVSV